MRGFSESSRDLKGRSLFSNLITRVTWRLRLHFGKWDSISEDDNGRSTCLWHDLGFMLVRVPIVNAGTVTEWILLRRSPHKVLATLSAAQMDQPFIPPISWADGMIRSGFPTGTVSVTLSDAN